jgi:hypothetical protein
MNRYNVDFNKILKRQYFIYAAFTLAPLIYLYIAHLLNQQGKLQPRVTNDIILMIFPFVAIATAIGGIIFRKYMNSLPIISSKETFGEDFAARSLANMIIYCAFFESIAVYGLVTVLLSGILSHLYYYVAASLILLIIFRPTRAFLKKVAARQEELVNQGKFCQKRSL